MKSKKQENFDYQNFEKEALRALYERVFKKLCQVKMVRNFHQIYTVSHEVKKAREF